MNKSNQPFLLVTLFFVLFFNVTSASPIKSNSAEPTDSKGLFTIQFSWNKESFDDATYIEIEFKKKGLLGRTKSSVGTSHKRQWKNQFIDLELKEGEYEIKRINMFTTELVAANKYYVIPLNKKFIIKAGQITNAGMIFLVKENKKASAVMPLTLNNTDDVGQFIKNYRPEYSNALKQIKRAWDFIDDNLLKKINQSYAKTIVDNENKNPRKNIPYLRSTLGMIFKLEKDDSGLITDYKLIPIPTIQEVMDLKILKDGKLLATLANGSFLYGTEHGMGFLKLPPNLEREPTLKILKNGKVLLVDKDCKIYHAEDASFLWKEQMEYKINRTKRSRMYRMLSAGGKKVSIYQGKKYVYLYSPKDEEFPRVMRASYESLSFAPIKIPEELTDFAGVHETERHLILGPKNHISHIPGYIYVKEAGTDKWVRKLLPKNKCERFYPGKDEAIWYTECGKGEWYETTDYADSWQRWKSKN